jgi:hypothetical protein
MRSPARFLLFVLLVIAGVKLSEQAYALVAFRDERTQARALRERLLETGTELVAVRGEADSLKAQLEGEDGKLEDELHALHRYSRMGPLSPRVYDRYRAELARYNLHVVRRNAVLRRLEGLHERHHGAVTAYNLLADSLHALAVEMGEPYYQVPTALEAAAERRNREDADP